MKGYVKCYTINYHLNARLNFNQKLLGEYKLEEFPFDLDFEKYGIVFDDLIVGDTIYIETNKSYRMPFKGTLISRNTSDINSNIEVRNITLKKANVVRLEVSKSNDEIELIDECNPTINYHLIDDIYTVANEMIYCVFDSLNGGNEYTFLSDLEDSTIVYGTYIEGHRTNIECLLHALYSFNPLKKTSKIYIEYEKEAIS